MMGGIGFTVGLIGFLLYTLIGIFGAIKYNTVRYQAQHKHGVSAYGSMLMDKSQAVRRLSAFGTDLYVFCCVPDQHWLTLALHVHFLATCVDKVLIHQRSKPLIVHSYSNRCFQIQRMQPMCNTGG